MTGDKHFTQAVNRCEGPGRPIRLLLSKPDADGLQKIARKAGRNKESYQTTVRDSLRVIASLKDQEKNIEVRFYRDFPAFRLLFINGDVCLASHYVLGKGDGSSLPQLQIVKSERALDTTSLYYAFDTYFQTIWEDSESWNFKDHL